MVRLWSLTLFLSGGLLGCGLITPTGDLPGGASISSGSTSTNGSTASVDSVALCATYCQDANTTCSGNSNDLDLTSTCPTTCSRFPTTGKDGDTSGDTVQCRITHLGLAASAPGTHCAHASVSGDNECGTWCDVYCREALTNCTGANQLYADAGTCATACAAFATTGNPGDSAGNTVQCRIWHLDKAASDAATHCPHGGATSAPCQ